MAYTLVTQSYGVENANSPVIITDAVTGQPAVILASASGGIVSDRGIGTTNSAGVLSVYIDTARTYTYTLVDQAYYTDPKLSNSQITAVQGLVSGSATIGNGGSLVAPAVWQSATLGASVTGTLTITPLGLVTIPATLIGGNGQVTVESTWSYTNNGNIKTLSTKFGGQSIQTYGVTTTATSRSSHRVSNRNNVASQTAFNAFTTGGFGTTSTALLALAVNTASAVDILFEGQLTNAADSITLESYQVVVWPKA